jgi:glutathione S-transferase
MSLILYYHPLSSFCWKALIALYDAEVVFEPRIADLGDEAARAAFLAVWPMGKFPVLGDSRRGITVPESSIVVEYLAQHHPGAAALIPADPELALQARLRDRILDHYVHQPLQVVVGNRIRPTGQRDAVGVEQARAQIRRAYDLLESLMTGREWAVGETFTLADCAALPALFYGDKIEPMAAWSNLVGYLERLKARPSVARVLAEAEPYFHLFPEEAA